MKISIKPCVMRGTHMDGRLRWRCFIQRMSRDGRVVGLNILFSDTSETVAALERAEMADKAKSNFLAKMSHEIRTPINTILGLNEVILRESRERDTLACAADIQNAGSVTLTVGYDELDADTIRLKISVADTGIGVKPEDIARLTTPFARMEESKIRSIEGTRLGLAITKQLLGLMGSSLRVDSIYGEGSDSAAGRISFLAPEARVLIVDDMPVNLTVVRGLLKRTQMQVDTAESGQEALALAARQSYDVAFINHMMPEMDGVDCPARPRRCGMVLDKL